MKLAYCDKIADTIKKAIAAPDPDGIIAEAEYFHKSIEKSRTTSNMMSGKPIVEPVNTPNYMSTSSEAYWSM